MVKISSFSSWCPSRWNSISFLPGQFTRPNGVKIPTPLRFWMFRGQFRLTKKGSVAPRLCLRRPSLRKGPIEASFSVQAPRLDLEPSRPSAPTTKMTLNQTSRCRNCQPSVVLSEELLGFPFFAPRSCETQKRPGYGAHDGGI
ncbi:hypothetical protein GWK47_054385 [Chionoecetes opilio]|uniref:Uncharacterized protein n=1 Tax=Chionoecetes opilio TaxID=41210 RepID=A0A8J4Y9S5_CHIOP|nr:hypothetical protein GWK47_054385 [Chionoecetes opilio]